MVADGFIRVPRLSLYLDTWRRVGMSVLLSAVDPVLSAKRLKRPPWIEKDCHDFCPFTLVLFHSWEAHIAAARSTKEVLTLAWPHSQSPSSWPWPACDLSRFPWRRAQPRTHRWGAYGMGGGPGCVRLTQWGPPLTFGGSQSSAVWPSAYSAFVESSASRFLSNKLQPLSSVTVSQGHGFGIVWLMQAGCDHIF